MAYSRRFIQCAFFLALMMGTAITAGHRTLAQWQWPALPGHVVPPPTPPDNPMTEAKILLGRMLFYEPALSRDGSLPCAECHQQSRGFTDGEPVHRGVSGEMGLRNVPGLANVAWRSPLTWADPAITTLERQSMVPMMGETPVEMGMHGQETAIATRLSSSDCYRALFALAFPERKGAIDMATVAAALSAFERSLISFRNPYDAYMAGDAAALPAPAQEGAQIFQRAGCASCHSGSDLTDNAAHYVSTSGLNPNCGYGKRQCRDDEVLVDQFRTPSLRNVAVTGPWLHDGNSPTVEDAIRRHAAQQIVDIPDLSPLLAFLDGLTDRAFLTNPAFAKPSDSCAVSPGRYRPNRQGAGV